MPPTCSGRRHFLTSGAFNLSALGLAWLLKQDRAFAEPLKPDFEQRHYDLLPKAPPFQPRATAMISMFMQGGPSHLDLFDPKEALKKLRRTKVPRRGQIRRCRSRQP